MKNKLVKYLAIAVLIFIAFIVGRFTTQSSVTSSPQTDQASQATVWICSMHPQVRQSEPGLCPICEMDLIPESGGATGERQIEFTEAALKLMEIQTTKVQRKSVNKEIRIVGKIDYDETKVKYITAWVAGRIDRLYADYTGIRVSKGDHMVDLYSPQLLSAQAELVQASKSAKNIQPGGSELVNRSILVTLEATREKLRLLGLTEQQIQNIEKSQKASEHLTIYAPIGGVVIHKNATEGMYVQTGTRIYTIADLSHLWVKLDAYESDAEWLLLGQEVHLEAQAIPGKIFKGTVAFIAPVVTAETRTIKVRVNITNLDEKLKPGMFVRAILHADVAEKGMVIHSSLAGKYVCPMHLDFVADTPGACDICGMDLVASESLVPSSIDKPKALPLVIPASAPLVTGKRAVVYVRVLGTEKPTFQGKEIRLGPRVGDYYIVESGLMEGEIVVTNGNFKIDSAMQIKAMPSMMSPPGGQMPDPHAGHSMEMGPSGMNVDQKPEQIAQTICPVMDGPINKDVFTMYKGKKVYFCCPGCDKVFNDDPEKYLDKLPQFSADK